MNTEDRIACLEKHVEFLESLLDSVGPRLAALEQRVLDMDASFTARMIQDLRKLEARGFRPGL